VLNVLRGLQQYRTTVMSYSDGFGQGNRRIGLTETLGNVSASVTQGADTGQGGLALLRYMNREMDRIKNMR
jgi:hypothetical protein